MTSQMAMISTVLPIAFGLFSLQFPAGLVLYFLVSNLWRLGQQELIMHKITGPIKAQGPIDVKGAEKPRGAIEVGEAPPAAAPRASGGLRKLFQPSAPPAIEPGPNGDVTDTSGNGTAKQSPAPSAKPKPNAKSTTARSGAGKPAGRSGNQSGGQSRGQPAARRKSNKRRKRR
jgi:YidC/Oxa1 family membrane protein insertase